MSTCSAASLDAAEELGGTGMVGTGWACVESRSAWGRDPVADGEVSVPAFAPAGATALAIRRPGRDRHVAIAFSATTTENGGELRVHELPDGPGRAVDGLLCLVCTHGRRDPCCSRLGIPVWKALDLAIGETEVPLVWQCSHTGGHRFAPNVVVLPVGVTLGRVPHEHVPGVVQLLRERRLPLELYRGRSLYPVEVQAAEVHIRRTGGFDGIGDLSLVAAEGGLVTFRTPAGEATRRVVAVPGPVLPKSCGAEPEQVTRFDVEEA
ncbi:MAG: sucrase ferredoxin [Gaiellales bacterium]